MAEENHNVNAMEQKLQQTQQNARILWRIAVLQQKWEKLQRKKHELQRKIAELQEAQRKLQCQNDGTRIAKKN